MEEINYFDIIANVPADGILEHFESKMKIAERDFFCKPETFIKRLAGAIDDLKKKISEEAEKQREYLNNEIKNPGSWEPMYLSERGLKFSNTTDEQKAKAKEYDKQRRDKFIEEKKSMLEEVSRDEEKHLRWLYILLSKVDELQHINQNAGHDAEQLPPLTRNLSLSEQLPPLTRTLSLSEQHFLFRELAEKGFIDKGEDYDNFCFAFGGTPLNKEYKKICWKQDMQSLINLLDVIKISKTTAEMKRKGGLYFLKKKGQTIRELPRNNKQEGRNVCIMDDILKEFMKL